MDYLMIGAAVLVIYYFVRPRTTKLSLYRTEYYMEIDDPVPLCGAPDVIWRQQGKLVVGDYKSRKCFKVYPSDQIQLSVYRLLLAKRESQAVADYGFIHFQNGTKQKVKLLSEKDVIKLVKRYQKIMAGKVEPAKKLQPNYCCHCSHQAICQ